MKNTIFLMIFTLGFSIGIAAQPAKARTLPLALASQLVKDDSGVREKMRDNRWTVSNVAKEVNYLKFVDLNADGVDELIFSGIVCGTANCQTWIYRKIGAKYEQIPFDASAVDLKVLASRSSGYSDISIEGRGSAVESEVHIHKFDGRKYDVKECFSKNWALFNTRTGKWTELKTPRVERLKCSF